MKMKKVLAMLLAVVMIVGVTVAGTVAWLMDSTEAVTNTFTSSDVDITLEETTGAEYKMVPGEEIEKDPTVTVLADSEACWLFVKIEESENYDDFMTYGIADGWTELPDEDGVYYRAVADTDENQEFAVLQGNQVVVSADVTKDMMDDIDDGTATKPTLTFTAYAIQQAGFDEVAAAWAEISNP